MTLRSSFCSVAYSGRVSFAANEGNRVSAADDLVNSSKINEVTSNEVYFSISVHWSARNSSSFCLLLTFDNMRKTLQGSVALFVPVDQ